MTMAIEDLIANGIQYPKIITPFELQAGQDELNQNKLLNIARKRALDEQMRQDAMRNGINRLYQQYGNDNQALIKAAARQGYGEAIPQFVEQENARLKEQRLQEKDGLENVIKKGQYIASRLRSATPENWEQTVAEIEQDTGAPIPRLRIPYDKNKVDALIQEGLSNTQAVELEYKKRYADLQERQFEYGRQKDAEQMDIQRQNAENQQQWNQANFEQRDRQIEATRINKPMTVEQGKANIFGTRAQAAHDILLGAEDKINTVGLASKQGAENIPIIGGAVGAIGNSMLSDNQQKVDQAQRDFVNAVLRNESGAVISPGEFDNAKKQYFPQPGDSDAVIEQKRRNRETEINGLNSIASGQRDQQPLAGPRKTIVKTGTTRSGKKVVQYSDGTIEQVQ